MLFSKPLIFALSLMPTLAALADSGTPVPQRETVLAPGYANLLFTPPAAGTYALPPIGQAVDGAVLKEDGHPARLHELFGDKLVLLSFIYSSCNDVNGCPLATAVLHKVRER